MVDSCCIRKLGDERMSQYDFLYHHGILGQKWGVRRFQKENGSMTSAGKKRYAKYIDNDNSSKQKQIKRPEETNKSDDNRINSKHTLSDRQKTAIKVGAAAVGTAIIAIGAYKLYKSGKLDKLIDKGKDKIEELKNKKANNKIEAKPWIEDINPGYKQTKDPAFRMNCGNCAIAYEMRSRGMPAEALGNGSGMTKEKLLSCFTGIHDKTTLNLDNIKVPMSLSSLGTEERGKKVQDTIAKQISKAYKSSSSARGTLFVPGPLGSHYISWEKQGRVVAFFNSQDTTRDLIKTCFAEYMPTGDKVTSLMAIRLDDLEINMDAIKDFVKMKG